MNKARIIEILEEKIVGDGQGYPEQSERKAAADAIWRELTDNAVTVSGRLNDTIRMPDGGMFIANEGIVGIGPDLTVHQGYDGHVWVRELSQESRVELARYMVARWLRFMEASR